MGSEIFTKAFGIFVLIKLFFIGTLSSGIGDAIDLGFSRSVNNNGIGLLMNYSIWTQAFFKDGSKSGL